MRVFTEKEGERDRPKRGVDGKTKHRKRKEIKLPLSLVPFPSM